MGLALLALNAEPDAAREELPWAMRCLEGLMDQEGCPVLPGVAIDRGGLAYAALRIFELTGQQRYLRFAREAGNQYLTLSGAAEGCIPYTAGRNDVLVDTVAFICPFLARLTRITGDSRYRELALTQLESMWQFGGCDDGWVAHAFDMHSKQTHGLSGWGRGVGWLMVGIADTVIELENGGAREHWLERATVLLGRLETCQRNDGHWSWRVDQPEATADSSVTALVGYALARLMQARLVADAACGAMLERCCEALDGVTDTTGRVGQCSGEAGGIGAYSSLYGNYLWAQAPAVALDRIAPSLASAGMLRTSD